MRINRKRLPAERPRASLLAATVLSLSLSFALTASGCGATSHSANGDKPPRDVPANAAQSAQTPAAEPVTGSEAPDGASAGAAKATPDASTRDGEVGFDDAALEDESSAPAQEFKGTAGSTEKKRELGGVAILREVRSASHSGFDRVVFVFEGDSLPGHRVEYVDRPVRQCGSGRAVRVAGDGWLLIRLEPAQAHTEEGEPTVKQRERRLNYSNLKELKLICDFEAQVEWVLGLNSPNRYRVLELRNPARLVLDVQSRTVKR
jgi:hypothetical protein